MMEGSGLQRIDCTAANCLCFAQAFYWPQFCGNGAYDVSFPSAAGDHSMGSNFSIANGGAEALVLWSRD
jgi:hypothetical protein